MRYAEAEVRVPWYWILIIISAIVGPFEAMHTYNKARQRREREERQAKQERAEKRLRQKDSAK